MEASLSVLGTPVVAILSSRLTLARGLQGQRRAGIVLTGGGLALLSLFGWLASRQAARLEPPAPEGDVFGRGASGLCSTGGVRRYSPPCMVWWYRF